MALQILEWKFYKNTRKSSLYSHILLIFIHKTPTAENHPTSREIRELLRPRSKLTGITVYFYMSCSLIYILICTEKASNMASDEVIMENNYMFVML